MTTKTNKRVFRETEFATVKSGPKYRPIIVGIQEGDLLTFRLKGERRVTHIPISSVFYHALRLDMQRIQREKAAARKAKKGS